MDLQSCLVVIGPAIAEDQNRPQLIRTGFSSSFHIHANVMPKTLPKAYTFYLMITEGAFGPDILIPTIVNVQRFDQATNAAFLGAYTIQNGTNASEHQ